MAIKQYKPTSPARRGMTTQDLDMITTNKPVRSLTVTKKKTTGRNNQGRITIRHRGGGVKRRYRLVDFKLNGDISATVEHIEYDPNRSARLARLKDSGGKFTYILAGQGMKQGQKIKIGEKVPIEEGNRLQLRAIPAGSFIYNIELQPGRGGQMVRSAGTSAQLTAKEGDWGQVKLPSGEVRRIHLECRATIGSVGNEQHQNVKLGSAGRKRKLGWRPTVHGKAMNPADHPMGGGEGKSSPGRHPRTPWGKPALGYKTRRRKDTDKYIVRSRHQAKRR